MSDKHQMHFIQLVSMFHGAAMIAMGKIKNPESDKMERDLERAQFSIDTLDMLLVKTSGNVTADEKKFLETILQELKLNFVDEQQKNQNAP
jgi:uncharacterized protein YjaG (DUF416 family)